MFEEAKTRNINIDVKELEGLKNVIALQEGAIKRRE